MTDAAGWDARYGQARVWSPEPNQLIASLLADLPPGTALDLAAGEGRHAVWLARRGWQVTAVDFSQAGLRRGAEVAATEGLDIDWIVADVTEWRPSRTYDLVLVAYLQLPARQLRPILERLPEWLSPGGRLLVLGHDIDNLTKGVGGPQDPDVLYDPEVLRLATTGLAVDRLERVDRAVETEAGPRVAIDTLLWARRAG